MKKLFFAITIIGLVLWIGSCQDERDIPVTTDHKLNKPIVLPDNQFPDSELPPATVPLIKAVPEVKTPLEDMEESSLTPDLLEATLREGESVMEHKNLFLPANITPPKTDILICFDLTGSMGQELNNVKVDAANIITSVRASISDSWFGVISHMDYVGYFTGCGYGDTYGSASYGDYPYMLNQSITDNSTNVVSAINSLSLGNGWDGPENYTRAFYESYSDPSLGFRTGTKKIVLAFLDAIPHDCAYNAIIGGSNTTGPDPGRDAIANTADDLAILNVLNGMLANNVTLIPIFSGTGFYDLWQAYAAVTGGQAFQINPDGTIPGGTDIPSYITSIISGSITEFNEVKLEVCDPLYSAWLTSSSPSSYTDVVLGEDINLPFDINITVPAGTPDGEYCFEICAVGDGVELDRQNVCITVVNEIEVPLDIKPQSCPNPVNFRDRGLLPVAILGTEDFDVTLIDISTITLSGVYPMKWDYEDVATPYYDPIMDCYSCSTDGMDGYLDLTLKFDAQEFIATLGPTAGGDCVTVEINGQLYDATPIIGSDVIKIIMK